MESILLQKESELLKDDQAIEQELAGMKVLVFFANYGLKNMDFFREMLDEYTKMPCQLKIIAMSEQEKTFDHPVEVRLLNPGDNPRLLPFKHKEIFQEFQDDYDLFIYSEDDTFFSVRNLKAYWKTKKVLPENHTPGFMRYEQKPDGKIVFTTVHRRFHWQPDYCETHSDYQFGYFTNMHSALYILTRDELKHCLAHPSWMNSTELVDYKLLETAATQVFTMCGIKKVICLSHIEDFLIAHMPNVYYQIIGLPEEDLMAQVESIKQLHQNGGNTSKLFPTETTLHLRKFSKHYYQKPMQDLTSFFKGDGKKVLSIGTGSGEFEQPLLDNGYEVEAIPLDLVIGKVAERNGIKIYSPDFDLASQEMSDKKFDFILLNHVLEYLPNPAERLTQIKNHLAPNGRIIIISYSLKNLSGMYRRMNSKDAEENVTSYDQYGIQPVNFSLLKSWLSKSQLKIKSTKFLYDPKHEKISKLSMGLLDAAIANKIIITAN